MAIVNHAKREINAKIVYYGPENSGKATSLRYIYDRIRPALRGELKSLPSNGSSLLFFDFSPFEQPVFAGYRLRLHVYTLHGLVANPAAWKMTLKGADGVMVVADSAPAARGELLESMLRLREFLGGYGLALDVVPNVLQLNKCDTSGLVTAQDVAGEIGIDGRNACHSSAVSGEGVLEALAALSRQIMDRLRERDDLSQETTASEAVRSGANELGEADDSETQKDESDDVMHPETDVPVDVSENVPCRVVVVSGEISSENGMVRIPLDVCHSGGTQRLVVSVAVSPGEMSP